MKTIVREALETVGLNPDGAVVGAIGAAVAVVGKVNGYSWKMSVTIIVSAFALCGYLLPALAENWPLQPGTLYFLLFVAGFTSSHIYKFIDKQVPLLLNLAASIISKRFRK
jgi:hypothetical protein